MWEAELPWKWIPVGLQSHFSTPLIFCVHEVPVFLLPARVIKCQKKGFCKSFNTDKKQHVIYRDEESLLCPFPSWIVRYTHSTSSALVQYFSQYFTTSIFTFGVGKLFSITFVEEKEKLVRVCFVTIFCFVGWTLLIFCFLSILSTLGTENHDPKDHSWDKVNREKTDLPKDNWEGG